MKIRTLLASLVLVLIMTHVIARERLITWIDDYSVPIGQFKDNIEKDVLKYSGVYSYGVSEGESELSIFIDGDLIVAQHHFQVFRELADGTNTWADVYVNLKNVRINGNKFEALGWKGIFVTNGQCKGLLLLKSKDKNIPQDEFGCRSEFDEYGRFPETQTKRLTIKDLVGKTPQDLKIMRNEIFARYGFKFEENGEMDRYFQKQDWYVPKYKNVGAFLTSIEKKNLEFIKTYEKAHGVNHQ